MYWSQNVCMPKLTDISSRTENDPEKNKFLSNCPKKKNLFLKYLWKASMNEI